LFAEVRMSRAPAFLVAVVVSAGVLPLLAQAPPLAPARDRSARTFTGAAVIRGRATEAGTDRPLARVSVRAISPAVPQPRIVRTDANGRYEIDSLPPGRYVVSATKANYLTTSFGATRAMGPGAGFDLGAGQTAENVNLALVHAGAIAGKVVDEFGEPLVDAQVMTMRVVYANGERRMAIAPGRASTNDVGEFRAFGLPPGDYFIAATFRSFLGGDTGAAVTYAPTFYPGTANVADAQRITVGAGQTVADVVLPVLPVQTTRISGSVIDSHGRAASTGVVSIMQQIAGATVFGTGAPVAPDGTFSIGGVAPGDYILRTGNGVDQETATASISVNGSEISGVQLVTAPPSVVRGRIVFGAGAAPLEASAVHLNAVRDDPRLGNANVTVHDDLTFEIKTTVRRLLLRTPNSGPRWRLDRVLAGGVDITDTGIDVPPNTIVSNIVVEMTHHVSELSGRVLTSAGQSTRDAYVIVFTQDQTRWTRQSRHVAMSRPGADDRFRVLLPAGDYFVFATSDLVPGQWTDPAYLARIREHALSISIAADDKKSIDVALSVIPES
jgi:hypothetical protein